MILLRSRSGVTLIELVIAMMISVVMTLFIGYAYVNRIREVRTIKELNTVRDLVPLVETHLSRNISDFLENPPINNGAPQNCADTAVRFKTAFYSEPPQLPLDYTLAGVSVGLATSANLAALPSGFSDPDYAAARTECLSADFPTTANACALNSFTFCLVLLPLGDNSVVQYGPAFVRAKVFLKQAVNGAPLTLGNYVDNVAHADRGVTVTYRVSLLRERGDGSLRARFIAGSFDASTRQ